MPRERPPAPLATLVTDRLRAEIVEGALGFGDALSEAKIARRLEVSRTPVREAFARLELEGLVRTEPQYGTYVFTMDREQFAQISELRAILECAALRLAATRDRAGLLARWETLVGELDRAAETGDVRAYSRADGAFHDALFEHCGNPHLETARKPFAARLAAIRNRLGLSDAHVARSRAEHAALLAELAGGRTEAAADLLRRHITEKGAGFWSMPETPPASRWQKLLAPVEPG